MFGRHHTIEARRKQAAAKDGKFVGIKNPNYGNTGKKAPMWGKKLSEEARRKISRANSRDNHPAWKGGVTPEQTLIRTSATYKAWRVAVFVRDDYTCQVCGLRGGRLNADHIKRFSDFPALRLEVGNGRTLCVPCHRTTETYGNRKVA